VVEAGLEEVHRHFNAVRASVLGHDLLTLRNVTAEKCAIPIRLANFDHVTLDNIRVLDHQVGENPAPPIQITNSRVVFLRAVLINGSNFEGPAVDVVDSNDVVVEAITLEGESAKLSSGVRYLISDGRHHSGLRISNVSAPAFKEGGILLDSTGKGGSLANYIVQANLAQVNDRIKGDGAVIANNLPATAPLSSN
jgi:hypothetical protein